jgi:hypothetical protein
MRRRKRKQPPMQIADDAGMLKYLAAKVRLNVGSRKQRCGNVSTRTGDRNPKDGGGGIKRKGRTG